MRNGAVSIVGGGLVGSLAGIYLAHRGLAVAIHERRADPRRNTADAGRSINLVVTSRGLRALERVGLREDVLRLTVPVTGRMLHALDGELTYQPYGRDESECNHSISRGELNRFLLTEAERRGVPLHFDRALDALDPARGELRFERPGAEPLVLEAPVVLGADGAGSAVRRELVRLGVCRESVEMLEYGYKELVIPADDRGGYRIAEHALHIWPRGATMLMALPNRDGSFTVTLYLPLGGPGGFQQLGDARAVRRLFEEQFPDSLALLPDLERQFADNPVGELGTVRCSPWRLGDRALLIGDAAHAIVPFFGQGMNTGFEDCHVLDGLLDEHGTGDLAAVFERFDERRKPDADAIADMALDNFVEMRDRVADDAFLLRKQVEHRLEQELPHEYRSRYSMVMYSSIPFHLAQQAGRIQQELLGELCRGLRSVADLDLGQARRRIRERLTPFLERHEIRLDY